ncbi:acyl-CoA dehydrogenase family protein [Amycolatopsis magusensis]|uniref:Alkylation response protein AidB-like acyl-CoA dehydrogenase n=1 Tax=Amycolatopsis magusensis TaxID=882444 RepID=A0ABS4PLK0_9PSEU|nr:acyl-CoA dehydrogenase family protein [Amycolatopsis magusensis]MBP2179486.1 alkylation response protein AidB-like acyl-CoA dehydrogenase [Amycolatopsis magusensis]
MSEMLERARRIADEVFFPAADEVDASGVVPRGHFDLLAEEGFYGLAAPAEIGGPGLELPEIVAVLETLAGGCLSTTFTWMQHHGVVLALSATPNADLREQHLAAALKGETRFGVAFAGAIPPVPRLRAERVDGGFRLQGEAPFVSGWGDVDLLQVSARDGDQVINGLIEPDAGRSLRVEGLDLVAAQATNTVRLEFDGYELPASQVVSEITHAEMIAGQVVGSRLNGCLACGLTGRIIRLLGSHEVAAGLRAELDEVRRRLDAGMADLESLYPARAAASELAYRAAGVLVAATGSAGVLRASHPQRLARESVFTLVAAGRPQTKAALLDLLVRN